MEIDMGKNVSLYERKLYVLHIDEVGMLKKVSQLSACLYQALLNFANITFEN